MATTVQQVFDMAMALADIDAGDAVDYMARAVPLINVLSVELYQFSAHKNAPSGRRPLPVSIAQAADTVDLDDGLARGTLPYGLAAGLLAEENPAVAAWHAHRYAECLKLLRNAPCEFEPICDVYGEQENRPSAFGGDTYVR